MASASPREWQAERDRLIPDSGRRKRGTFSLFGKAERRENLNIVTDGIKHQQGLAVHDDRIVSTEIEYKQGFVRHNERIVDSETARFFR